MSEGTAKTPTGVSGEMKVERVNDAKTGFVVGGIEYGLEVERDMNNPSSTASATDGAAAKGGDDLKIMVGQEVKYAYRQAQLDMANVKIAAKDGKNPNKEDRAEEEEKTTEDTTRGE